MQIFNFSNNNQKIILAIGAESAGNFSIYKNNKIYFSKDFGDLLDDNNWLNFKKSILNFLKKEKIKPNIIITDLHPLMKTTLWGEELAKKFKAEFIQVQHHHAHIFSAIGESLLPLPLSKGEMSEGQRGFKNIPATFYCLALDGTGYGTDELIWGGECFAISNFQFPISKQIQNSKTQLTNKPIEIQRIGQLENQILLGGEIAIQEPARIIIAIIKKILNQKFEIRNKLKFKNSKSQKEFIYNFVKKYYSKNKFELLYNQLEQNFNCIETSSTGRILDAVSLLLGFCGNERKYKHEAIDLLEANSTKPYTNLKPKIIEIKNTSPINYSLQTTHLFKYLIKNLHKDKKRLAATAQLYIAEGLCEIVKKSSVNSHQSSTNIQIFAGGGVTNNKIISDYFASKNVYLYKNTSPVIAEQFYGIPRGDAGLSFGQIIYFLLSN